MDMISLISTVGFPIAVTIFLLLERNKSTKELTQAINNNSNIITKLCERLDK